MEAPKLQYSDLTESEKRFIARMEKARIENPALYLAIIAIIHTPGTNEDIDWAEGHARSEFKRAIKILRTTQKEAPQCTGACEDAIFQTDESGGCLIGQIGITAFHEGGYADLVDDVDWQDIYQEHNVMVDARLKANFRAGYWELIFKHTKPLGVIPKDMRAS